MDEVKFKIDDVVMMKDDFHFNPTRDTVSIGKIQAIHIHRGKGLNRGEDERGVTYQP